MSYTEKEEENLDCVAKTKIEQLTSEFPSIYDPVIEKIRMGFVHFKINNFDKNPKLFDELAEGQSPKFLVFSCSDSRVSPSHVLNFQLGEAFMIRNIANIAPPFNQYKYSGVGAAIEYAMLSLKVENILVMGHSRCGGIHRLMTYPEDGSPPYDFIDDWMKIVSSPKARIQSKFGHLSLEEQCEICEKESVNISLGNLLSYPYIQSARENKALRLWGGYYNFVNGTFELWEFNTQSSEHILMP